MQEKHRVKPINIQHQSTTIRNVAIGRGGVHKFTLDTELTFDPPSVTLTLNKCSSKYPGTQFTDKYSKKNLTALACFNF